MRTADGPRHGPARRDPGAPPAPLIRWRPPLSRAPEGKHLQAYLIHPAGPSCSESAGGRRRPGSTPPSSRRYDELTSQGPGTCEVRTIAEENPAGDGYRHGEEHGAGRLYSRFSASRPTVTHPGRP
jgi:hypothetical protein